MGEIGKLGRIRERPAKTKLSFEDAFRFGKTSARQQGSGHASLPCFTEMKPLDHGSFLAAGKFHQASRVGAGDAESVDHLALVETQQPACRHGGTKSTCQPGRVKASSLAGVSRRHTD